MQTQYLAAYKPLDRISTTPSQLLKAILSHRKYVIMEYKDSYVNLANQNDQQIKYIKVILLTMCKIKECN